jgi:hypothetical protein
MQIYVISFWAYFPDTGHVNAWVMCQYNVLSFGESALQSVLT